MRRPRKLLLFAACGLAAAALFLFRFGEDEPSYQGRPLSHWIAVYSNPHGPEDKPAVASVAIGRIGTNALPWLLNWIAYEPSRLRVSVAGLRTKSWVPYWVTADAAMARAESAMISFEPLGPDARSAIPALVKLARGRIPGPSSRATVALSYIGPDALPALLEIAADTSATRGARVSAIRAVGRGPPNNRLAGKLGTNALSALPIITRSLRDQDAYVAGAAAIALGDLKIDPEISVPALAKALGDPRPGVRGSAASALGMFQDKARSALPSLIRALTDSDLGVRVCAELSISHIDPELPTDAQAP